MSFTLLRTQTEIAEDKKEASVFLTRMISTRSQEDMESSVVDKLLPCQTVMCVCMCECVCVCVSVFMDVYVSVCVYEFMFRRVLQYKSVFKTSVYLG